MAEAEAKTIDALHKALWIARRSVPDDLRAAGLSVAVHNDYTLNGERKTFWCLTAPAAIVPARHLTLHPACEKGVGISLVGEGATDEEALDQIRARWAYLTDTLHHAPFCPANHYHGQRAPTYHCTCGAAAAEKKTDEP